MSGRLKTHRRRLRLWYSGLTGPVPKPEKWCFLVGCYNSGTTLLHKILSSHESIACMPNEGQFFTDTLPLPMELGLPRLWAVKPERFELGKEDGADINVRRLKKQWGANINDLSRPVVVEKSPTNAARILWLEKHFQAAHFVGIVRNGYAVAEGIRRKAGHSIEQCAQQWNTSNQILVRDLPRANRNLLIRYEDLTSRPTETVRQILDFLELNSERFLPLEGQWSIHEQNSSIKNMNSHSARRLSSEDIRIIRETAEPMLTHFSYDVPRSSS